MKKLLCLTFPAIFGKGASKRPVFQEARGGNAGEVPSKTAGDDEGLPKLAELKRTEDAAQDVKEQGKSGEQLLDVLGDNEGLPKLAELKRTADASLKTASDNYKSGYQGNDKVEFNAVIDAVWKEAQAGLDKKYAEVRKKFAESGKNTANQLSGVLVSQQEAHL